jgi:hypothetical protein
MTRLTARNINKFRADDLGKEPKARLIRFKKGYCAL